MLADSLARALDLAVAAALAPRTRILATFRSPALQAEAKADGSPVTAADREAERIVRTTLRASAEFGAFQILGEEAGLDGAASAYRWIVDPIDGPRAYTRGLPTFGTTGALAETATGRALTCPANGATITASATAFSAEATCDAACATAAWATASCVVNCS